MKKQICILIVLCCGLFGVSFADDIDPPGWRTMEPPEGENWWPTFQAWEFDEKPPEDDGELEPGELPEQPVTSPTLTIPNETNQTFWEETFTGRQGVWRLDGREDAALKFEIPNHQGPGTKRLRIQMTFWNEGLGTPQITGEGLVGQAPARIVNAENGWRHYSRNWRIEGDECPAHETVTISPPGDSVSYIDEVVIDTACFPIGIVETPEEDDGDQDGDQDNNDGQDDDNGNENENEDDDERQDSQLFWWLVVLGPLTLLILWLVRYWSSLWRR